MSEETKIKTRGGKREGAGRKTIIATERKISVTIQIKKETLLCLDSLCEKESNSRSIIIQNLIKDKFCATGLDNGQGIIEAEQKDNQS